MQWTIDAYSLTLASLLLVFGSLGDILGRRRVFAGRPHGIHARLAAVRRLELGLMLVLCRAFQGIGGATILPTALALVAQTFTGKERGFAFGIWGAVAGAATGIGPLLGGLLTSELSWRWIFFVNLPIGVLAILITLTRVREFRPPKARRIDVPGLIIFSPGLFALVYGLIEAGRDSWGSTHVIVALIASAVLLTAFPLIELSARSQCSICGCSASRPSLVARSPASG